jgi:hypothetical protein
MALPSKPCIVCGRPIPRDMTWNEVRPVYDTGGSNPNAKIVGDLYDRADCLRRTNHPYVTRLHRNPRGLVIRFDSWDGESFMSPYFCTNRCAERQGYQSARDGHRWNFR